jgi:uncharacterized membrane protein YhhN
MLFFVWVVVVSTTTANWFSRVRSLSRLENFSKPTATISIAGLAVLVGNDQPRRVLFFGLLGFLFCLLGDIALLKAVDSFLVGLSSFLLAHIAFMVAFFFLGLKKPEFAVIGLAIVALIVFAFGRTIVTKASATNSEMRAPVVAYLAVISTMTVAGWATGNIAATVGATLFVISDAILGWRAFVEEKRWMSLTVMMTYHGALVGLALSLR